MRGNRGRPPLPRFCILECFHMIDGTHRKGTMVPCVQCDGKPQKVVLCKLLTGSYTAVCTRPGCTFHKPTGSSRTLAQLYSSNHQHHDDVEIRWERSEKQHIPYEQLSTRPEDVF